MSHSLDAICLLLKDLDLKQLQLVRSRVNYEIDVKDSQQEEYMFGCFVMLNKVFYFV